MCACEVLKADGRQLVMSVGCAHVKKGTKKETDGVLNRLTAVFLHRWCSLVGLSKHHFSGSFGAELGRVGSIFKVLSF